MNTNDNTVKLVNNVMVHKENLKEITERVKEWCESADWRLEHFESFLEQAGFKLPVYIERCDNTTVSALKVIQNDGTAKEIFLMDGDWGDDMTEMEIRYANIEETWYTNLYSKSNEKFWYPKIWISRRTVKLQNRTIEICGYRTWVRLEIHGEKYDFEGMIDCKKDKSTDIRLCWDSIEMILSKVDLSKLIKHVKSEILKAFDKDFSIESYEFRLRGNHYYNKRYDERLTKGKQKK